MNSNIFHYLCKLYSQKSIELLIEMFSEIYNKNNVLFIANIIDINFYQKIKK